MASCLTKSYREKAALISTDVVFNIVVVVIVVVFLSLFFFFLFSFF